MKLIVLYQELAYYTLRCMEALATEHSVEIHIVALPVNKEAPFQFKTDRTLLHIYNRHEMDRHQLQSLVDQLQPNLIYCAGWIDKEYLQLVKHNRKRYKTLLGFDNQWHGTWRQYAAILYGRLFLRPLFHYAFVPGNRQRDFALKLGFAESSIFTGAYSADVNTFFSYYQPEKPQHKTFLYVGRYVAQKNIQVLWEAFIEVLPEIGHEWKLICAGTGDITPIQHSNIVHHGFVQPTDFQRILDASDIYILPSTFEPWGVSVHEMAAAGFPMILSTAVGAGEAFLEEGKNGYRFAAQDKEALKTHLKTMARLSADELQRMRIHSHQLAHRITPKTWAQQLMKAMS